MNKYVVLTATAGITCSSGLLHQARAAVGYTNTGGSIQYAMGQPVLAGDGNFYAVAQVNTTNYPGTLYRFPFPSGPATPVVQFNGTNGSNPYSGLLLADSNTLYGTTQNGGPGGDPYAGDGVVFKYVISTRTLSVIHNFDGADGSEPTYAPLVTDGSLLYGTTVNAGHPTPYGNVFAMTTNGTMVWTNKFNVTDGVGPESGLTFGYDGYLYGSTTGGGLHSEGTLFRVDPSSGAITSLFSFTNGVDGSDPVGSLVLGNDGNLYGTTQGANAYCTGTIFRITTGGIFNLMYDFPPSSGSVIPQGLVLGPNGDFYGITQNGGINGVGSAYRITTGGLYDSVFSFSNSLGSAEPNLFTFGHDNQLYGTSFSGSNTFSLSIPMDTAVDYLLGISSNSVQIFWPSVAGQTYCVGQSNILVQGGAAQMFTPICTNTATGATDSFVYTWTGATNGNGNFRIGVGSNSLSASFIADINQGVVLPPVQYSNMSVLPQVIPSINTNGPSSTNGIDPEALRLRLAFLNSN